MKHPVTTYLGLGSNQGNRFQFLQQAINAIYERVGPVTQISPAYQTPAWGFDGDDFLNACIAVTTYLSADKLLKTLQDIEQENGRKRSSQGYINRTLDLDILFYDDQKVESQNLCIPHPKISERLFVLRPFCDIAPHFVHPVFKKELGKLLQQTADKAPIHPFPKALKKPEIALTNLNFLAIEGNIGAGKTSLATMISREFNAKLITERFKDNPFLPKFYRDQARYAFPLEMSFLADRYQQLADGIAQYDLFNDFIVADYDIFKSMIFAQITLPEEEIQLYRKLFHIMCKDLVKPDLYVYLYQNTERLLQNIKNRGREYEQKIPSDYLNRINQGYLDFIKTQQQLKVKIIDISGMDFIDRREDYLKLIRKIISN